jgi:type I restriction enzyme, S subunit
MAVDWTIVSMASAPVGIIDGDRGKNYPKTADFFEFGHCLFLNAGNVTANGFDFSRCQFITEEKDKSLRKGKMIRGDVVLTTRGTVGNVAYYDRAVPYKHVRINSGMVIFRPDTSHIEPRFLYFFLRSSAFSNQVSALRTGSAQPQLPIRDIILIEFPLPEIKEQQAIACILGALDDKIELNCQMNRTLETIARAIFKSWFIDFDPVRAKVDGGQPPGLAPHIADLFPDSLEDSEIGKIPREWKTFNLQDLIEINPTRRLVKGIKAPYLNMANMPTEGHCPESWMEREFGSGMRFMNGDTLVARITPCLENGKTAYVDFLKGNEIGWGSTEYIVLRPHEPIPAVFAYLLARSPDFRSFAIQRMTGSSGRQRVPADNLAAYQLTTPPIDSKIFEAFGKTVSPYFKRIHLSMRETRILKDLRDTLLPKLISGELRVPDAERIVGRSL